MIRNLIIILMLTFSTSCMGPAGPRGVPGQNGTNGQNGVDGQPGADGQNGTNGQVITYPPAETLADIVSCSENNNMNLIVFEVKVNSITGEVSIKLKPTP